MKVEGQFSTDDSTPIVPGADSPLLHRNGLDSLLLFRTQLACAGWGSIPAPVSFLCVFHRLTDEDERIYQGQGQGLDLTSAISARFSVSSNSSSQGAPPL
jgi:hypothetical protein